MSLDLVIEGAGILRPDGLSQAPLAVRDGRIAEPERGGRRVDLSGYLVLPGIVDIHGDGFERHLAPRRGAMKDLAGGLLAAEAELAANGITTAVLAQFFSWEGGLRGPEFAAAMLDALAETRSELGTDMRAQLRLETHMLDDYPEFEALVAHHDVDYVVFNDHLPHERLAAGRHPRRLAGTALRSGRSPEALLALLERLHANGTAVPGALDGLSARLRARGVRLGSHDDRGAEDRARAQELGAEIAEFPETVEAAEAARRAGAGIVLGAPNLVRGGSHKGNVSALDLVAMGLCDALASDYHYPSPRRAAFHLVDAGVCDLSAAWSLVSAGPARLLGLDDRGSLVPGRRADLIVLEVQTRRLCATLSRGCITYLAGPLAARLF